MSVALATLSYLPAAFALCVLTVRFRPHGWTSTVLRRHLWLFPVIPALWLIALGLMAGTWPGVASSALKRLFERLSGHKMYRRMPYPYERSHRPRGTGSRSRAP